MSVPESARPAGAAEPLDASGAAPPRIADAGPASGASAEASPVPPLPLPFLPSFRPPRTRSLQHSLQHSLKRSLKRSLKSSVKQPIAVTRDLLTGFYEIGGVSLSRLAELQAGALQQLAEANRVRVASVRAQGNLPALIAAEQRFYGAIVTQLRHGIRARVDLLRDAGHRTAALLRAAAVDRTGPGPGGYRTPADGPAADSAAHRAAALD